MSLLDLKIILTAVIFLVTFGSGLLILLFNRFKNWKFYEVLTDYAEAFACGIFLGIGLIIMLNLSNNTFVKVNATYPWAFFIAGVIFLILLLVEHLSHNHAQKHAKIKEINHVAAEHNKHHHTIDKENCTGIIVVLLVSLSIHSFIAGIGLGLGNQIVTYILFLGIILHKWVVSMSVTLVLTRSSLSKLLVLVLLIGFSLMTPLGVVLGSVINFAYGSTDLIFAIFTAISAGTFIYIGTLHGLYNSILVTKCCDMKAYCFVLLGFGVSSGLSFIH